MKRFLGTVLLVLAIFVTPGARADDDDDDFCMDCAEKTRYSATGTQTTSALCCMVNDDGICFGGFFAVQPNVGFGCQISAPDSAGNTSCASLQVSDPCGSAGGGGTGGGGGSAGGDDCSSSSGYCPASCSSCTYKI